MINNERFIVAAILGLIAVMVSFDIYTDSLEGALAMHLLIEGLMALAALFGVFYVLQGSLKLKHKLDKEISDFSRFREEAKVWQSQTRKYLDGLSEAIDQQLSRWHLSVAEKEVAFLLLKGLSLKEIASVRGTSEKTARVQSVSIYSKSGLSGRSELSAFFLEDLLLPNPSQTILDPKPSVRFRTLDKCTIQA